MKASRFSFMARNDVLLGVCAALSEDLGFNPLYLRMTLAVLLLWNPVVILSAYAAGFVLVLASRVIFPAIVKDSAEHAEAQAAPAHQNDDELVLAKAA
ncbi:PspC domain-containing protein [Sphingomonas tabacisoli]|uniref:PspC domain-containing protein n=1 Tax=Sphingomonas tabacisoli TaxID=2249466 RepID=A0ABW4I7G0_9SPHN